MREPIYQNRNSYSFFNALKEVEILNELNSLDFVRAQIVIHFKRISTPFVTKMNKVA